MSDDRDKTYPATCPYCGNKIEIEQSLGMLKGSMFQGFCICPHCSNVIQANYDQEQETITAVMNDFTETLNQQRALGNNQLSEEAS